MKLLFCVQLFYYADDPYSEFVAKKKFVKKINLNLSITSLSLISQF